MKVLKSSLLVFVSVACSSGGGGGTSTPPKYIPSISEPAFEKISDLETEASFMLYSKCDSKIAVDPRIKQGQVYTGLYEGMQQSTGEPFRTIVEMSILNSNENNLNYLNKTDSGTLHMRGEFTQSCKTEDDKKVCGTSTLRILESNMKIESIPVHYRSQNGCQYSWSNHYDGKAGNTTSVELGKVKLPNGETVTAVRIHKESEMKDHCEKSQFARSVSTRIETFALPSLHTGYGHCSKVIYSEETLYHKETGAMIKADRSALLGSPKPSEIGTYPGMEDVMTMFPAKKKDEPKNEEVAQK